MGTPIVESIAAPHTEAAAPIKLQRKAREVARVTVYSRHREDCKRKEETNNACMCPKWARYYRLGKMTRISLDTCDEETADTKAAEITLSLKAASEGKPAPERTKGKLLEDAVADFLTTKEQSGITKKHVAKLRFEMGAFKAFVHGRGLIMLAEVLTEHALAFRNQLEGAQNTRAKKIFRLIGFFEFCVEMGWISRNPARARSVVLKYDDQQTPKALDDAQFTHLLASIALVNGRTTDATRTRLRSLVMLMRWTGLAIRDALFVERARFIENGVSWKMQLRRAKTGHPVYCRIKNEVMAEVLAGAKSSGRYLFVDAVPEDEKERDNAVKTWGDIFRKLGEVADLKDSNGEPYHFTSHALRHSFVLWCLNHEMPTEDVAALIGDSVEIVARHYSEWIEARQARLDSRMLSALGLV
jgi:integrase/recombinase XerD